MASRESRARCRGWGICQARITCPFGSLVRPDGTLKPAGELRAIFEAAGVNPGKPAIASCGSGVTACVLALGAGGTRQ